MRAFGFSPKADESRTLLGYYAESSGNFLPTFWDNLSVPSAKCKNPKGFSKPEPVLKEITSVMVQLHYT
jgi:hypothetical protein